MSIRSGQSITTEFTTRVFATGVATNGDSLPTGTLYVNGTANGAAVTVTNISTGLYKAAVTLPTLAVGDVVAIVIAATVSTISDSAKIWEDSCSLDNPTVIRGTVGATSPSTTSFTPSALEVAGIAANQLVGRVILFDKDTTTTALRGQGTTITGSGIATLPLLTVNALTTAPVSGDVFGIY